MYDYCLRLFHYFEVYNEVYNLNNFIVVCFFLFFKVYFGEFKFVDKTVVVSALVNRKIKTDNHNNVSLDNVVS